MNYQDLNTLFISLGIGLLVGLQRERAGSKIAGIRTFSLITLTGTICGLLARRLENYYIIVGGLISLALILLAGNAVKLKSSDPDSGQTTEVSALLMFLIGVFLVFGDQKIAVAVGAITAILLYLKSTLGNYIQKMQDKDIKAIMQFVAISLVILPILPNEAYGPYKAFNPFNTWIMVVLIVGIGVVGYFLYKWMGNKIGTISNGILGGMISSTATTATFSRMTVKDTSTQHMAAFIIFTASTVSFIRVIFEVSVIIPGHLRLMGPPLISVLFIMTLLCIGLYFYSNNKHTEDKIPELKNPAQLNSALIFGLLYAIITLAVAVANDYMGKSGIYIVSVISGLTDVDAITLSLSNQIKNGVLNPGPGWRLILLASLANLVFKGALAFLIGHRRLRKILVLPFIIALITGCLILLFWPGN